MRESFPGYSKGIVRAEHFCYICESPEALMKKQLVLSLGLLGCVALASPEDVKQSSAPKAANASAATTTSAAAKPTESYPVIGYLEKRNYVITIMASPQGTIYSIATKDGKILHENVSAEQLKAKAPELYQAVKTGLANDARLQAIAIR